MQTEEPNPPSRAWNQTQRRKLDFHLRGVWFEKKTTTFEIAEKREE